MGRLSEKIKSAAPKRRKLAGLERRWLINNVSVMVVLAALCVAAITLSLGAYYYSNVRSGLEAKAKTTTDFFSNYISQSYNEYYQSCIQFAQTFEEKDRLELQFITPDGRMVASSYGEFAGKSPQTPDIQEAVTTGKLARFQGKDPDTHERILAVSSPMVYSNGEVIGVLRYVTGLKNVDRQILMIGADRTDGRTDFHCVDVLHQQLFHPLDHRAGDGDHGDGKAHCGRVLRRADSEALRR